MVRLMISALLLVTLLFFQNVCCAQSRTINPYLGAAATAGPGGIGWCFETGLRMFPFYAGLEGGAYSPPPGNVTVVLVPGHIRDPFIDCGRFWGIHAGYIFKDFTYLGFALLKNSEQWEVPQSEDSSTITSRNYFDFGPDFRYSGLADGHLYLAFALTYRRGLKAGLGYVF